MKTATALRKFFSLPGHNPDMVYDPVSLPDIKELKDNCTPEEYHELGKQACELMGETFEG